MKTKIIIISVLLSVSLNLRSQTFINKNKVIDSLLININGLISKDLLKDSIHIGKSPYSDFGDSYLLEAVYNNGKSILLTVFNRPNYVQSHLKQIRSFKASYLRIYVEHYDELPYNKIDYLSYKFLCILKKDGQQPSMVYGEYKLKTSKEGVTIIDKKTELIKGLDPILEKYNSDW